MGIPWSNANKFHWIIWVYTWSLPSLKCYTWSSALSRDGQVQYLFSKLGSDQTSHSECLFSEFGDCDFKFSWKLKERSDYLSKCITHFAIHFSCFGHTFLHSILNCVVGINCDFLTTVFTVTVASVTIICSHGWEQGSGWHLSFILWQQHQVLLRHKRNEAWGLVFFNWQYFLTKVMVTGKEWWLQFISAFPWIPDHYSSSVGSPDSLRHPSGYNWQESRGC